MKAFCLAIVFVSAAVPACANEMSAATKPVVIEQSQASRLYSQQRISAVTPSQEIQISDDAEQLLEPHQAVVDGARSERVRELVKAALREVERASVGAQRVLYKIRVSCRTRRQITRKPRLVSTGFNSVEQAEPSVVAVKSEACTVDLKIARQVKKPGVQKRDFSVTLPDLASAAAQ